MSTFNPPPSLWRRLAAIVYDSFLVIAFAIAAAFLWKLLLSAISLENNIRVLNSGYLFIWLMSLYGFFQFFWLRSGQTLGMVAWRLQLKKNDGSELSLLDTSLRWLFALVSAAFLGIGYFWCLFNKDKKTWQDILSNTHLELLPKKHK